MSDLNMNFEKLNKACKEVNEKWRKMMNENNPFDTISKIAKDIRDREDRELALAFTNVVGSLLRDNGVFVKTSRYELETDNETDKNKYIIKKEYRISIDGLDFTEHDKKFKDEIRQLKHELEKTYNQIMEVEKESQERIAELESELETKVNFETDRLVKLPFDALETANMLINATYRRKVKGFDRFLCRDGYELETDMYSVDDLEHIAEHLLVYCKHNREVE